jgi:hypothetical protein
MTLRIFEVSSDGVAKAVPKDEVRREPPPPAATPQLAAEEPSPGATEWDKLRTRLQQEPQGDAGRRRDPTRLVT